MNNEFDSKMFKSFILSPADYLHDYQRGVVGML